MVKRINTHFVFIIFLSSTDSSCCYSNIEKLVLWAQVRDIPPEAGHRKMSWGIGKLEWWNIGFSGRRSFIKKMALSFRYPSFHFSTIPIFHSASIGKQNPFGMKSKLGPPGQVSLLISLAIRICGNKRLISQVLGYFCENTGLIHYFSNKGVAINADLLQMILYNLPNQPFNQKTIQRGPY